MRKANRCLQDRKEEEQRLLRSYAQNRDQRTRDRLVLMHQSLVRFLAGKFANRGEPLDDLIQVGMIGLIHAVDRYDSERGTVFSTFATPTIVGEIRRHFRDKKWSLKVPRRLKELNWACNKVSENLSQSLGRAPTVEEVSEAVGASEEDTLAAMEMGNAYETVSLDTALGSDGESTALTLAEFMGELDPGIANQDNYGDLFHSIECLDERQKSIIYLRFFEDKPQAEVAEILSISQMHVSRLQDKALKRLKELLDDSDHEVVRSTDIPVKPEGRVGKVVESTEIREIPVLRAKSLTLLAHIYQLTASSEVVLLAISRAANACKMRPDDVTGSLEILIEKDLVIHHGGYNVSRGPVTTVEFDDSKVSVLAIVGIGTVEKHKPINMAECSPVHSRRWIKSGVVSATKRCNG